MTKPIAEARVEGDFRPGTRLQAYGRTYTMETRDKRYFISVDRGGRPAESFEVNYTLGARRFQGYLGGGSGGPRFRPSCRPVPRVRRRPRPVRLAR